MAVEIPVYIDIDGAFQDAAKRVNKASDPLVEQVERVGNRMSSAIQKAMRSAAKPLKEGGVEQLNSEMSRYLNTARLAANQMLKLGDAQGKLTAGRVNIKATAAEVSVLASRWNSMKLGSKFDADGKLRVRAQELIEKMSKLTSKTIQFGQALADSSSKAGAASKGATANIEATNAALSKQSGILSRITGYLSVYTLLFSGIRFIRNLRETTAEFEMQRVALGGIINDAEEANMLFRKIKAAAIESPFQIKDLVTYTKQLSAYRVETENLFDVTTKLADVSAGLGVDMGRLILAYGQVRAAAVLRGQELRQFTEAGIPLVEKLAEKFTYLNGRMVSTADVFELISKRAVPFEMIAEIFDDMTSAGGTFYKMQEKQAETLAGQWSNLKDALSIMYDEIGNTKEVHGAMEGLISDARFLMQNWRVVAQILKTVAVNFAAVKVASLFIPTLTRDTKLAAAAEAALAKAQGLEAAQTVKNNALRALSIKQLRQYSRELAKAAAAQTAFGRGWHKLAAGMVGGGWIGIAATAAAALAGWLISAWKESRRLDNELAEIGREGKASIDKSVYNFKKLADAATAAADGSNEQNEALAELRRTYGDIIPSEDLQIKKLRELEGNYTSLTAAIKQKISMQTKEQEVNAVQDYFSSKIQRERKKTIKLLSQYGLDKDQINAVLDEVQNMVDQGLIKVEDTIGDRAGIIAKLVREMTGIAIQFTYGFRDIDGVWHNVRRGNDRARKSIDRLISSYIELNDKVRDIEDDMSGSIGSMGLYANEWVKLKKEIDSVTISEEAFGEKKTFSYKKEKIRAEVELMAKAIEKAFDDVGIDISGAINPAGKIDFEAVNAAASKSKQWGLSSYIKKIQKSYEEIVPTDQMVDVVEKKFKELAAAANVSMDDIQGYLFRGNKDIRSYVKDLQEDLQAAEDEVNRLNLIFASATTVTNEDALRLSKWEAIVKIIKGALEYLQAFKKETKTPKVPYQQDPFIKQMQERIKFMKDFRKGYDDLNKYMSDSAALEAEGDIMKTRGMALGLSESEQKKAAKDLAAWYGSEMNRIYSDVRDKYKLSGDLNWFLSQEIKDVSNKGKALRDWQSLLQSIFDDQTDIETSEAKKSLEKAIQKLKEELKQSEAAKNFFQDIFDLTGDRDLATNMTVSVYGDPGKDIGERVRKSIADALNAPTGKGPSLSGAQKSAIENAAKTLDFREVLKEVDQYPDHVADAVRQAAGIVEKYNIETAKSYAKLLSTYGDTQQKEIDIKRRSTKDKETLQSGLDKELIAIDEQYLKELERIDKDATIIDKKSAKDRAKAKADAAEEAATSRVKTAKASVDRREEYDLYKLSKEYSLFFNTVGVLSKKSARDVAKKTKEMLAAGFAAGDFDSIHEYQREIERVNKQLEKYEKHKDAFYGLVSGEGFKGVADKITEISTSILGLSEKIEIGEGGVWEPGEDAENFLEEIDFILNKGDFAKLFKKGGATISIKTQVQDASTTAYNKAISEGKTKAEAAEEAAVAAKNAMANLSGSFSEMAGSIAGGMGEALAIFNTIKDAFAFMEKAEDSLSRRQFGDTTGTSTPDWMYGLFGLNSGVVSAMDDIMSGNFFSAFWNLAEGISELWLHTEAQNAKIREQQELIDDLQYSYGRLGVAMEKSFGSDYISNYNQQISVLQAQAEAYRKQAELEKAKDKKQDPKLVQQYLDQARDVEDQIADMQSQLSEFFTGTDLTSAAKDFAQAWIEAYKQFGNTTDAMKEKFSEMIENMVVNSLAAQLIQGILKPVFKAIDDATDEGELTAQEIGAISAMLPERMRMIDDSMLTMMNQLTSAGINLREQAGQFTGISRDIAGASEESITGLAAGINTQNFYISHIDANVAAILAAITGGASTAGASVTGEYVDPYKDFIKENIQIYFPSFDQKLGDILNRLDRVIRPRTDRPDYVLHTNL